MFIRKLQLTNFKNHAKRTFLFEENLLAFVGKNGMGKTNILDAIYFLCIGKSYFSKNDKLCIKQEESFFRLVMEIDDIESKEVILIQELNKRKNIKVDGLAYEKLSDHLGVFPIVIVAPNDNQLILGSAEERRKYMDQTLSQLSRTYLRALLEYNALLKDRNALLKQAEERGLNKALLEIYNQKLSENAQFIYEQRKSFSQNILAYFKESYRLLAGKDEDFNFCYQSDLEHNDLTQLLEKSLNKDLILKRTTKGIHRDDLIFSMGGEALKDFGSQGQQKTFLLALKLTQFNFLKAQLNKVPLFIIDDIFDKLDAERSINLVKFLAEQDAQVFISHTGKDIFQAVLDLPIQLMELTDGEG
ncbi:MAG: DNA replication and repair protein RecF [Chitinophagales bacterium]|nr:DNA replication and repair protein RecF [Chitinophagales bacterium]